MAAIVSGSPVVASTIVSPLLSFSDPITCAATSEVGRQRTIVRALSATS